MPRQGKRHVEVVDLTHDDQENAQRPTKVRRNERMDNNTPLANVSNGRRFGGNAQFIPLSQLDEDETGVNDIVQASQVQDDPETDSYQLYGICHSSTVSVNPKYLSTDNSQAALIRR